MTTHKAKTAKQATIEVLRRAGQPLKSAEIARRALKVKDVRLAGKTPVATVLTRTYRCHGSVRSRNAYGAGAGDGAESGPRIDWRRGLATDRPFDSSLRLCWAANLPSNKIWRVGARDDRRWIRRYAPAGYGSRDARGFGVQRPE